MEVNEIDDNNNCFSKEFYILLTGNGINNKNNYGTLIRSASAFNCKKLFLLSSDKAILKKFFGNQGTTKKMEIEFFETLDDIKQHCIEKGIFICGIGKEDNAFPIQNRAFKGSTLFVFGNGEFRKEIKDICNQYTYVDQYSYKEKPINQSIVGSIVFHHYALWANYRQTELNLDYNNEKYIVYAKNFYIKKEK